MAPVLGALRALGARVDDGGRGTLPFARARARRRGQRRRRRERVVAVRVGPAARRAAAARRPRCCGTPAPTLPSLPHIEMTVHLLRDAGVGVDDSAPGHLAGDARTDRSRARSASSRTCPTPPRSSPRRWWPAARSACRAGPWRPPSPARCCPSCSTAMGGSAELRDGDARGHRNRRRPRDRRRPAGRERARADDRRARRPGRLPQPAARDRAHARPRDRPPDRPRGRAHPGRGPGRADRRRSGDHAPAAARQPQWQTYHDHRMATAGALVGLRCRASHVVDVGDHRQDPARLRRACGRPCSARPQRAAPTPR